MTDKILPVFSDFHCGSPVAIFPDKRINLKIGDVSPNGIQLAIYRQWRELVGRVAELRKETLFGVKKEVHALIVGDLVEGIHHESKEIISPYLLDHRAIFTELWDGPDGARERMGLTSSRVIEGTLCHAGETEDEIAEVINAVRYSPNSYTFPMLKADINGVKMFAAHHGPPSGKSERSRGDSLRNHLKDILDECLAHGKKPPRIVIYADKHVKAHALYERGPWTIDGFLLPSWKVKDRFVYKVAAASIPNIGGLIMYIPENGNLIGGPCKNGFWEWSTMDIEQDKEVAI